MTNEDEPMQAIPHDPHDALDRLLALRPDDLDGWEATAAAAVPADERAAIEADDAALADLIDLWTRTDADGAPDLNAAAIRALDAEEASRRTEAPLPPRRRRPQPRAWWAPVAMAASLAILGVAGAMLVPEPPPKGIKSMATATEATRIGLQFSIETRGLETTVTPGQDGGVYGAQDWMAVRFDLRGEPAFVWLYEVGADGASLLVPQDGTLELEPGVHPLTGADGSALVYQPDADGPHRYLAVATDASVDPNSIVQGVLEAGVSRPDLWPRHVLAVDSFEATWRR